MISIFAALSTGQNRINHSASIQDITASPSNLGPNSHPLLPGLPAVHATPAPTAQRPPVFAVLPRGKPTFDFRPLPARPQPQGLPLRHLHQDQLLTAGDQEGAILRAAHFEGAPEADAAPLVEPSARL